MNLIQKKEFAFAQPSAFQEESYRIDLFWYLLGLTEVNRVICRDSLIEFLTRFWLLSGQLPTESPADYLKKGTLVSGEAYGRRFRIQMSELNRFFGLGINAEPFQVFGDLTEFVENFQPRHHPIQFQHPKMEGIFMAPIFSLLDLDVLPLIQVDSLSFRKDTFEKGEALKKAAQFRQYAESVVEEIPDTVFGKYRTLANPAALEYPLYFHRKDRVDFDPSIALPRESWVPIFSQLLGSNHPLTLAIPLLDLQRSESLLSYEPYLQMIRFAYGVKNGFILLDDNWETGPWFNFSYRFALDPFEVLQDTEGELCSTQYLYSNYGMDRWINWV